PSELCGLDDSSRQLVFCCGVEGTEAAHAGALEQGVIDVLERVVRDGISAEVIEAVLDQIEMAQRDTDGDGFPHGLQLLGRLLAPAIHGADPAALLDLDPALERLRQRALEPGYVDRLVRTALLDNPHRLSVTMTPDAGLAEAQRSAEREQLAELRKQFDAATLDEIRRRAADLVARQIQQDDPEVLPSLTLADVPAAMDFAASEAFTAGPYSGRQADCAANGIINAQLWYPLPALDQRTLQLLPLLADYAAELGSGSAGYLEVQARRARIGSFDVFPSARAATGNAGALSGHLVVSGKALARKAGTLIDELLGVLPDMRIDEAARISELVAQTRAEAEGDVVDRGHALAMYAASALLSPGGWLDDHWDGLGALVFVKQLDQALGELPGADAGLGGELGALRDSLIEARPEVVLVGARDALQQMQDTLASRAGETGVTAGPERLAAPAAAPSRSVAFRASTSVNFCARAFSAVAEGHADTPALMVLGRYLHHGYLHRAIREQGGAYGSGAGYDADSGTFRFFSYRDPRLEATLANFENAVEWLLTSRDAALLEEAILGTVRSLDTPRAPAAAALRDIAEARYDRGPDFRRRQREAVLGVDIDALHEVARRYLRADSATAVVTDAAGSQRLGSHGYTVTEL
ncbi:MAG: peptidase M16, partial [Gammaproteobacteria bacterium]|nr:peptidase M16 [Gammaproteobacteria bacterium]